MPFVTLTFLGYRQAKRGWQRYRTQGAAGLGPRSRGQPSTQALAPTLRARVLRRYAERYPDFGPPLAAEYLAAEGLRVDHQTLRRWLVAAGGGGRCGGAGRGTGSGGSGGPVSER